MSEDNLKSLKELAHGAGIALIFGVFGYIFMFIFRLISARYFGPESYGTYSLLETIFNLAILVV